MEIDVHADSIHLEVALGRGFLKPSEPYLYIIALTSISDGSDLTVGSVQKMINSFQLDSEKVKKGIKILIQLRHDGLKLCKISKVDDDREISPHPFSVLYAEVKAAGSVSTDTVFRQPNYIH